MVVDYSKFSLAGRLGTSFTLTGVSWWSWESATEEILVQIRTIRCLSGIPYLSEKSSDLGAIEAVPNILLF